MITLAALAVLVAGFGGGALGGAGRAAANLSPAPPPPGNAGVVSVFQHVDGHQQLQVVSCPTTAVDWCAVGAFDGKATIFNHGRWSKPVAVFPLIYGINGISCASPSFCMALAYNGGGYSIYSHGRWSKPHQPPARVGDRQGWAVSCPTAGTCYAEADAWGNIDRWQHGVWSRVYNGELDPNDGLGESPSALSCIPGDANYCMYATDDVGYSFFQKSWSPVHPIISSGLVPNGGASVACSDEPKVARAIAKRMYSEGSMPACQAVDGYGQAFSWTGRRWSPGQQIDPGHEDQLDDIACVYGRCAAIDAYGKVVYQSIYANGTGSWTDPFALHVPGQPNAISCSSERFCLVVTDAGAAAVLRPG